MTRALFVLSLCLISAPARAQTIAPVNAGACTVVVRLTTPVAGGTEVELEINKKQLPRVAAEGRTDVRIALTGPLREGDELRARRVEASAAAAAAPGPATIVAKAEGTPECVARSDNEVSSDDRETFEASGYVGMAVDNFAPASVGGYANSEAGGRQTRAVGG